MGYSPWGLKESDTTERLSTAHTHTYICSFWDFSSIYVTINFRRKKMLQATHIEFKDSISWCTLGNTSGWENFLGRSRVGVATEPGEELGVWSWSWSQEQLSFTAMAMKRVVGTLGEDSLIAKSIQSCPTLYDSIDGSPPDSPIPGILQARTLVPFPSPMHESEKWKVKFLSRVRL